MRLLVATGVVVALAGVASGHGASRESVYRGKCGVKILPRGPTGLPAPVQIWTKCGAFLVHTDGTVSHNRKPGPWPWLQTGDRRPPRLQLPPARLRPRRVAWDSGVVANRSGELAFTATEGYTGLVRPGYETVYLLEPGSRRPRAIFHHRITFTLCGRGVQLWWRGSWLLYAVGEGHVVALDTAGTRVVDLTRVLRRLPGTRPSPSVYRFESAAWA
jgi:hypothetical protein